MYLHYGFSEALTELDQIVQPNKAKKNKALAEAATRRTKKLEEGKGDPWNGVTDARPNRENFVGDPFDVSGARRIVGEFRPRFEKILLNNEVVNADGVRGKIVDILDLDLYACFFGDVDKSRTRRTFKSSHKAGDAPILKIVPASEMSSIFIPLTLPEWDRPIFKIFPKVSVNWEDGSKANINLISASKKKAMLAKDNLRNNYEMLLKEANTAARNFIDNDDHYWSLFEDNWKTLAAKKKEDHIASIKDKINGIDNKNDRSNPSIYQLNNMEIMEPKCWEAIGWLAKHLKKISITSPKNLLGDVAKIFGDKPDLVIHSTDYDAGEKYSTQGDGHISWHQQSVSALLQFDAPYADNKSVQDLINSIGNSTRNPKQYSSWQLASRLMKHFEFNQNAPQDVDKIRSLTAYAEDSEAAEAAFDLGYNS